MFKCIIRERFSPPKPPKPPAKPARRACRARSCRTSPGAAAPPPPAPRPPGPKFASPGAASAASGPASRGGRTAPAAGPSCICGGGVQAAGGVRRARVVLNFEFSRICFVLGEMRRVPPLKCVFGAGVSARARGAPCLSHLPRHPQPSPLNCTYRMEGYSPIAARTHCTRAASVSSSPPRPPSPSASAPAPISAARAPGWSVESVRESMVRASRFTCFWRGFGGGSEGFSGAFSGFLGVQRCLFWDPAALRLL